MKTVDELMVLADAVVESACELVHDCATKQHEHAYGEARAALLTALQEAVHAIDTSTGHVEKSAEDVQMKTVDELMALVDDYTNAISKLTGQEINQTQAALLSALQEVVQPKCVCGENTLGVVHRADSPCYWPTEPHVAVAAIQPAQPVAQPSDEALLRQALKQLVKAAETMPCHFDDHFEAINALRARLKGDM